ncbi:hypothetical protein JCM8097_001110 [Rhodosporidiobolus ruineniae]
MAPDSASSSYTCTHCSRPVPSLYITYSDPSNTSLSVCPHPACGQTADAYQAADLPVVLLDVLLLRPQVYRHLLWNRGGPNDDERRGHRARETLRLGAIVVGVEAVVRCLDLPPPSTDAQLLLLYLRTFTRCLAETLLLLLFVSLALLLPLRPISPSPPASASAKQPSLLPLLPLTHLYASLPRLVLLSTSRILWRGEYLASSGGASSSSSAPTAFSASALLSTDALITGINCASRAVAMSVLLERRHGEGEGERGSERGRGGRARGRSAWGTARLLGGLMGALGVEMGMQGWT